MLQLEFTPARSQEFGGVPGTKNYVRLVPGEICMVEEDVVDRLFAPANKGGDPTIDFYRKNGDLLIRNHDGSEWLPGKGEPAKRGSLSGSREIAPVQVSQKKAPEKVEEKKPAEVTTPVQMGGGVPGQGVKDCKNNVKKCDDAEQLERWLSAEKRTTVKDALNARLEELKA